MPQARSDASVTLHYERDEYTDIGACAGSMDITLFLPSCIGERQA